MSLLVTRVLGDEVEVLSSDNEGSVHLGGNDGAGQDTATDGDSAGEGALLVYICPKSAIPLRQRSCPSSYISIPISSRCSSSAFQYFAIALSMLLSIFQPLESIRCSIVCFARTDVAALNSVDGGTETQTNVLVPSSSTLARSGALGLGLGVQEDVRLLLESTLRLDGQLGRPGINVSTKQSSSKGRAALSCKTDILNYPSPGRYRS